MAATRSRRRLTVDHPPIDAHPLFLPSRAHACHNPHNHHRTRARTISTSTNAPPRCPHAVAVTVAGCRYNYRDYLGDKSRVQPGQSRDYELSVFAVDAAGNAGPPAVFRWALDRRTPTTRLTVVPGDPSRVNANITFHWLSDEGGARRK